MQQQANAEHTELSELRKKLRTLHGVHQLQTGALESLHERHGTCENIAQAMALELQRICAVFNDANEKLEPPLPLDSIHALLASWQQYVNTKEKP
jgi:hypothetical protein